LAFALDSRTQDSMELGSVRLDVRRPRLHMLKSSATIRRAFNPAWSPRGGSIAFGAGNETTGKGDAYVMSRTGAHKRLLARETREPAWSPDGTKLAGWLEEYSGPTRFNVIDVRTGRTIRLALRHNFAVRWPFWSADGRRLAFMANGGNGPVYTMNARGGPAKLLARSKIAFGAWSHDWRKVAYGGRDWCCLYIYDRSSGRSLRATRPSPERFAGEAAWSADDRWIAFTRSRRRDGRHSSLYVVRANGTGLREVVAAGP
jgi:Tol biopolymer transport system component